MKSVTTRSGELLGRATCLLNPLRWSEPFGMVMIEALATGTPVVATPAGSVPEIVTDGVNGFIRATERELADAARRAGQLDRSTCRRIVADEFSQTRVVGEHVRLFEAVALVPAGSCRRRGGLERRMSARGGGGETPSHRVRGRPGERVSVTLPAAMLDALKRWPRGLTASDHSSRRERHGLRWPRHPSPDPMRPPRPGASRRARQPQRPTVAAELRSALDTFVGDVDVDLDGLQFVDLAGAELLLELSRGMDGARHRRVALVRPTPMFDRIVGLLRAVDADERCA